MTILETIQALCNLPDAVILLVLIVSAAVGLHKGFLHTLYKLGGKIVALIASVFLAKLFAPAVAQTFIAPSVTSYITKQYESYLAAQPSIAAALEGTIAAAVTAMAESIAYCILFAVCFVAIYWAISVLIGGLGRLVRKTPLGLLNHLGGGALGLAGGALLLLVLLVLLSVFSPQTFGEYGVLSPSVVEGTLLLKGILASLPPFT